MSKRDDALAALRDIKRAVLQGRDTAVTMTSLMIKQMENGEDLKPLPAPAPPVRTPMAPMATKPKPAPTPVPKPEVETTDKPSDEPDTPDKPDAA